MKGLLGLVLVILGALLPSVAEAQGARAIIRHPISQAGFAEAIRTDNSFILNVPCVALVEAANEIYGSSHADCVALARYITSLSARPCPVRETGLSRVLVDGSIDWKGWRRELREGEMCLYDNNEALWFASLSCGNYITDSLPVYTAMVREEFPQERAFTWPPQSSESLLSRDALSQSLSNIDQGPGRSGVEASGRSEDSRRRQGVRSWWGRNWKWVVPAIGAAAGGAYLAHREGWFLNENVNVNTIVIAGR